MSQFPEAPSHFKHSSMLPAVMFWVAGTVICFKYKGTEWENRENTGQENINVELPIYSRGGKRECPGFGQDRVNFHQEPAGDTARRADPTWPNRAGYSIPCALCWVRVGGRVVVAQERSVAADSEGGSVPSAVRVVYSPYWYRCCSRSRCLLFC